MFLSRVYVPGNAGHKIGGGRVSTPPPSWNLHVHYMLVLSMFGELAQGDKMGVWGGAVE